MENLAISRKEDELFQALKPVVEPLGVELVDVELKTHGDRPAVRVVISGDGGVDADFCGKVSRNVSPVLDLEDPGFTGSYDLEVSSPGLKRRIRRPDEYDRFQGKQVEVTCYAPFKQQKEWRGAIQSFAEGELNLKTSDGEIISIPEEQIASARLYFDAEQALKSEGANKDE